MEPPTDWPKPGTRPQLTEAQVDAAVEVLRTNLKRRLHEKGWGAWLSRHEVLGIIAGEHKELIDAVQGEPQKCVKDELLDIAVGAVFGVACIDAGTLEW